MKKAMALLLILSLLYGCVEALGETGPAEGGTTIVSPKNEFDFVVVISDPGWKYETTEDGVRISRLTEDPDTLANIMIASGPAVDSGENTDPRTAVTGFMSKATGESDPYISSWDVNGGYKGVYSHGIVPDSGAVLRAVMWLVGERMYIAAIYEMGEQADAEAVFLEVLDTFRPAPDEPDASPSAAPALVVDPDNSRYGRGFIFSVGIDENYPPFTYKKDGGGYAGFDVEMCEKVAAINGWNVMILPVEWNSILSWLDGKRIDCIWSCLTMSDRMKQAGYLSSFVYYDSTQVVLTRRGRDIKAPEDLAGCIVGVLHGSFAENYLAGEDGKKKIGSIIAGGVPAVMGNMATCEMSLSTGQIDAVILDKRTAQEMQSANKEFVIHDVRITGGEISICFRGGEDALCKKVEEAFMKLVNDGTYAELAKKYGLRTNFLSLLYDD